MTLDGRDLPVVPLTCPTAVAAMLSLRLKTKRLAATNGSSLTCFIFRFLRQSLCKRFRKPPAHSAGPVRF
jgi:hypothetical protein